MWRQIDQPFSFIYPADWKLEETLNGVNISSEDWMDIYAPTNVDLEELLNTLATIEFGDEPLFE